MKLSDFIIGYVCSNPACKKITVSKPPQCTRCGQSETKPVYDYFKIFALSRSYTADELKKSYKKLSLRYHPDINPNTRDIFLVISEGYQILNDAQKRTAYLDLYQKIQSGSFTQETRDNYYQQTYTADYTEADFEDFFRHFHNMNNRDFDLHAASSQAGTLGGILGLILGTFLLPIPLFGSIFGYYLGNMLGRSNPFLGPLFLGIISFAVALISLLALPFMFFFGTKFFPVLIIWFFLVYAFFNYKKSCDRIFSKMS